MSAFGEKLTLPAADATADPELRCALRTRSDARRLGRQIARVLEPGDLVVLEGDLGAGKTTLVRSIARGLGVPTTVPVTSPTFELVHELSGRMPVVHADLYRLQPGDDLSELGILARIGGDAVVLIEWGDRFAGEIGSEGLWISIDLGEGSARDCVLRGRGARGRSRLAALSSLLSGSSGSAER
jgi:tRNA threonylcarbamoyladenosine biosynthesis protein TsaE